MARSGYKEQIKIYRQAFTWIREDTRRIAAAALISLVLSATSGLATYSFLPVFDIVFRSQSTQGSASLDVSESQALNDINRILYWAAGGGSQFSQLVRITGFIITLSLITLFLTLLADYLFIQIQARGTERLRKRVFEHLCRLPMRFYNKARVGTLISRVENDIGGTVALVAGSISDLVMNIFLAGVLATVLLVVQPKLTLLTVPVLVVIWLALVWLGRWVQHNRRRILELQGVLVALMQEFFSGMRIIKGFSAEQYEQKRWRYTVSKWRKLEIVNNLNKAVPARVAEFVALLLSALIVLVGGREVIGGEMSVSELLLFFVVLVRFQRPASNLSRIWLHIQDGIAYAKRTHDLLGQETEPLTGTPGTISLEREIKFQNVSFTYGEGVVVRNVSFTLKKGEVVALVGPSGSGKSTIADLLIRFYEPTEGYIVFDGTSSQQIALRDWRKLFGVVTQDTFLFHDTVRANIAYAMEGKATQEHIIAAATAANAHDFIMQLPKQYDTVIGDRGVRLSGGQRQRIAIARAIIRSPQVLILDEATSALDTKSELQVQQAIERLIKDRTTLVIAHRLSTIQKANRILAIHEGRIVEEGSHTELLQRDGLYRHLWELQSIQK